MINFFLRSDNSKEDGKKNSRLCIPEHMFLRSAEVQKLLRLLRVKEDFITSKRTKIS